MIEDFVFLSIGERKRKKETKRSAFVEGEVKVLST